MFKINVKKWCDLYFVKMNIFLEARYCKKIKFFKKSNKYIIIK